MLRNVLVSKKEKKNPQFFHGKVSNFQRPIRKTEQILSGTKTDSPMYAHGPLGWFDV